MSWQRWKIGLVVAILSGIFTGLVGLAVGMTGRQIAILLAVNVGKDGLLYLTNHPVEQIDTTPPFPPSQPPGK